MKSVSFYIPCFNAAKTISLCLDAVLSQTVRANEVVVIDDGSTDETARIVSGYPVKLVRHGVNRGLASARNSAIRQTQGALIASVDADCVCEKDWLQNLMGCFTSEGIAGAGGKLVETSDSRPADLWRAVHMKQHWGEDRVEPPFLFGANTVFRRDAFHKAGFYEEALKNNYEDVDLCARLKKSGYTFVYEPKAVVKHLREDDPAALLNTYWRWHLAYYREEKFYASPEKFRFKIKENLGTANRYLEEDIAARRPSLVYLDFLFAFHHSLKDLQAFMAERQEDAFAAAATPLSLWLAFTDLLFFSYLDLAPGHHQTFLGPVAAFEQNCFALSLLVGKFLGEKFPEKDLRKTIFGHLLEVLFHIDDPVLAEKILTVIQQRPDWEHLLETRHPHLDKEFLEEFMVSFKTYTNHLISRFPEVVGAIEISAQRTEDTFRRPYGEK